MVKVTRLLYSRMPPKKHVKIEAPDNWETLYDNIVEMRKDKTAPVDTMGCEKVTEMSTDPKVSKKKKLR